MKKVILSAVMASVVIVGCQQGISKTTMENGKKVYQAYCQGCHMEDGGGVPNLNAPLIGSKYVEGSATKLITIVLQGSSAFADDPSRTYKNTMGSMVNLTDAEIADVLTYVRNSFTNKAPAITSEEVKSVRDIKN